MIPLTSKTYVLDTDIRKFKTAAKGAQKNINSLTIDEYRKAIFDNVKVTGTNNGFRMHDGWISTYEQDKTILSSEYSKSVIIDNVYTRSYMPWKIDSYIKIIPKTTKANQSKFMKTKIWIFNN